MLVFIDDSGDPGFKMERGSSSAFVIALVIFDDNLEAEKTSLAIKELKRKLKVSDRFEFKFNKSDRKFRKYFFESIYKFKFRVRAIVVKKDSIYSQRLKNYKEDFYNFIVMQVLKHSVKTIKNAKIKFDKSGEKALRDEMRVYLSKQLDNKNKKIFKDFKFVDSKQNTLVQLADMVAGSIFSSVTGKDKLSLQKLEKSGRVEDIWLFK
jgi:hypothetical protein